MRKTCILASCLAFASVLLIESPCVGGEMEEIETSVAAIRAGEYQSAAEGLRKFLTKAPGNREARIWLARALSFAGDHAGGEREYRRVLSTFPDDVEARLGLSDVLAWQHKYSESEAILVALTRERPDDPAVWTRRGKVALWAGERAEAKNHFERALSLDPQNSEAIRGLEAASAPPPVTFLREAEFGAAYVRIRRGGSGTQVWAGIRDESLPGWAFLGRADYLHRFDQDEGRGTAGVTRTWKSGGSLRFEAGFSPDAEVFSRASLETEMVWPLFRGMAGYVGGKFAHYASADAWNAAAAMEYSIPGANTLFVRYVFSRTEFDAGGASNDGTILAKIIHFFTDDDRAWVYYAHGTEGYTTGTVDQIGEISSDTVGLGARVFPWPCRGFEGNFEWQQREGGNRYITLTGSIRLRF